MLTAEEEDIYIFFKILIKTKTVSIEIQQIEEVRDYKNTRKGNTVQTPMRRHCSRLEVIRNITK